MKIHIGSLKRPVLLAQTRDLGHRKAARSFVSVRAQIETQSPDPKGALPTKEIDLDELSALDLVSQVRSTVHMPLLANSIIRL